MAGSAPNIPIGQRVGRLVVVEKAASTSRGDARWLCRCDCANEKVIRAYDLRVGNSQSCGCGRRKPGDVTCAHSLYTAYVYKARRVGMAFGLTKDETLALFRGDCHYCGIAPAQKFRRQNHWPNSKDAWQPQPFIFNGIDRVDSSQGYIRSNVVSCCGTCNRAKMDMSYDEFLSWIDRVHEQQRKRKRLTIVS